MQGETILCIAPRNWHSLWRDTQPIMLRIAAQNRVLYFEPGRNPDRSVFTEMQRNFPNFFALYTQKEIENLIVIPSPPSLPYGRRHLPRSVLRITMPIFIKFNAWIKIRHIQRVIKALDVKNPILWLYSPFSIDTVGKFGEKLVCYYNYDESSEFTDSIRIKNIIRKLDNQLSSKVDVVFASSQAQRKRRKAINPNTYFIPNGVDFELFNRALSPNRSLPDDIVSIPRPIIGFVGWLGNHIDVALLRRTAETYPYCSLVLVGPDELPNTEDRLKLRTRPNVFFLGQKERSKLPNYLQVIDVALMPYSLSGHILSAYPLKLHEYLAAGRAVVSTALPEIEPFSHVVRIAKTHDEFVRQISDALRDNTAQAIEARVAVARENTWDHRVAEVYSILYNFLNNLNNTKSSVEV